MERIYEFELFVNWSNGPDTDVDAHAYVCVQYLQYFFAAKNNSRKFRELLAKPKATEFAVLRVNQFLEHFSIILWIIVELHANQKSSVEFHSCVILKNILQLR